MTEEKTTRGPYDYSSYVAIPYLRSWRMSGKYFLSARELARKAGVAPATITRLEKGAKASFPTVRAVAKALHISPQELLGAPPSS